MYSEAAKESMEAVQISGRDGRNENRKVLVDVVSMRIEDRIGNEAQQWHEELIGPGVVEAVEGKTRLVLIADKQVEQTVEYCQQPAERQQVTDADVKPSEANR